MKKFLKLKNNEKGFTLVEILVVIVIFGILFTVILPRIDFASDRARETGIKTDFRSYTTSAEQYLRQQTGNNMTTTGFNSWLDDANVIPEATIDVPQGAVGVVGELASKDDPWGIPYKFEFKDLSATTAQFELYSTGKSGGAADNTAVDGTAGGADYVMVTYYRQGTIESCTKGFDSGDIELKSLAQYVAKEASDTSSLVYTCGGDISN